MKVTEFPRYDSNTFDNTINRIHSGVNDIEYVFKYVPENFD